MNKKIKYIALAVLFIIGIIAINFYNKIYGSAISKNTILTVKQNDTYTDIANNLNFSTKKAKDLAYVAKLKKTSKPKTGVYQLKKGTSINNLINLLRAGNQTPVKISFNNQDTLEKLAGRIAVQLEVDSLTLLNTMKDSDFLKEHHFTEKSALGMYIPNQYEFYWTDSAEKFRNKMLKHYQQFWNTSRLNKAKNLGLTKNEVITLASIVQKETAQPSERPIVAGLYLNRLKTKGWRLEADPTLIFALKEKYGHHKVYKRVLNKDKEINSPYNTYKNSGLPPTLIAMPDVSSIDAVLNPAKHNYFFMCASIDKIGYHNFAKTLAQHNRNAQKYQNWVNQRGINR